ncbi:MAG: NUDIX domain-containing protein [Synergistaceae bacterium]|nr:NUDIX domain-containing protein [Synergistaceae bacterium]
MLRKDGMVFLRRRPSQGLWADFEEFPWNAAPLEKSSCPVPCPLNGSFSSLGRVQSSFTRWRLTLEVLLFDGENLPDFVSSPGRWVKGEELEGLPLPGPSRKVRELLFAAGIISVR